MRSSGHEEESIQHSLPSLEQNVTLDWKDFSVAHIIRVSSNDGKAKRDIRPAVRDLGFSRPSDAEVMLQFISSLGHHCICIVSFEHVAHWWL